MATDGIAIEPLVAAGGVERHAAGLDAIFFEASSVRAFANEVERARFRERWLGRFLGADAAHAFIARNDLGEVVGYVVGSLDDPARCGRFTDIPYFRAFAGLTPLYPAHLHINLAPSWRNRGIGAGLIEAFAAHAAAAGSAGVHVVTGAGMRNVGFYLANGFGEVARAEIEGRPLVMLGRALCNA